MVVRGLPLAQLRAGPNLLPTFCRGGRCSLLPGGALLPSAGTFCQSSSRHKPPQTTGANRSVKKTRNSNKYVTNTYKSSMRALLPNQLCYSDIASKRVKHNTKTDFGHSRGTNFVTVISPQSV